jgi:hypothetical protein
VWRWQSGEDFASYLVRRELNIGELIAAMRQMIA